MAKMPVAVLIDGENVAASHIAAIMQTAEGIGEPMARYVVGDFSANRLAEWTRIARDHALEPLFQISCGKGKNSADIALTIRAMDLLAQNVFKGFLIVSSDCDFAPLALRLRRAGVAAYGMGAAKADGAWRNACTQFFDLVATSSRAPTSAATAKRDAERKAGTPKPAWSDQDGEVLRRILRNSADSESSWVTLTHLGKSVRQEFGDRFGKGKLLKRLSTDASFQLSKQGSSLVVRLKPCGEPGCATKAPKAVPFPAGKKQSAGAASASVN